MNDTLIDVLGWVNEVRRDRGLAPLGALPRGIPCDPVGCPIARALGAEVGFDGRVAVRTGAWPVVQLPPVVQAFAEAFDVGQHPGLEQRRRSTDPVAREPPVPA